MNEFLASINKEDYGFAMIHSLWYTRDNFNIPHMIFCMVEMFPAEIAEAPVLHTQIKSFDAGKLYFQRVKKSVSEAILWYQNILKSGYAVVEISDLRSQIAISCGTMSNQESEQQPIFELNDMYDNDEFRNIGHKSEGTPFVAEAWNVVRASHFVPKREDKKLMEEFIADESIRNWMIKCLAWDLASYGELLGTAHLVLPNPLYSRKSIKLIRDIDEKVKISFLTRKCRSIAGTSIECFGEDNSGNFHKEFVLQNNICIVQLSGEVKNFGLYVKTPEYGLLDYASPTPFIRQVRVSIEMNSSK